jgi:flagellar motor switch protein FliG
MQTVGAEKAEEILGDISHGHIGKPFEWVKSPDISRLANLLQHERPQVIALVLAHLNIDQASALLSSLPQELQGNVALRLTSMKPVDIDIVHTIDGVLKEKIARNSSGDMKAVGGVQSLVTILNNADRSTENQIISYLEQTESGIADSVKQMLFVFEDIVNLDNRAIQAIIRELDQEDLRLSLKGTSDEIREVFFKNMSERAVEAMREDLEMMGSVRRRDVEAAQRRVVAVIRRLEEAGEISTRPDDEEDLLI